MVSESLKSVFIYKTMASHPLRS